MPSRDCHRVKTGSGSVASLRNMKWPKEKRANTKRRWVMWEGLGARGREDNRVMATTAVGAVAASDLGRLGGSKSADPVGRWPKEKGWGKVLLAAPFDHSGNRPGRDRSCGSLSVPILVLPRQRARGSPFAPSCATLFAVFLVSNRLWCVSDSTLPFSASSGHSIHVEWPRDLSVNRHASCNQVGAPFKLRFDLEKQRK